jgi:hypothetical protein
MGKYKLVDLPVYKSPSNDIEQRFKNFTGASLRDFYDIAVLLNDGDDISSYENEFNDLYNIQLKIKENKKKSPKDRNVDLFVTEVIQLTILKSKYNLEIAHKLFAEEKNNRNKKKFYGGIGGTASILSFSVSSCICCILVMLVVMMSK